MSTDPTASSPGTAGAPSAGPTGQAGEPSEEELRAAYEAELSRITSADMMLQATVSLLNIASYRLAPRPSASPESAGDPAAATADVADLEQVRDSIDAVRALLEILERRMPGGELRPLREALSQLQMAYAREVQSSPGEVQGSGAEPDTGAASPDGEQASPLGQAAGPEPDQGEQGEPSGEQKPSGPGPAESSGRLWVPGR